MLLIFDRITEEDVIQAYEKTWYRFTELSNHDFWQTLSRWIEEDLKNEMRMWSWKADEWKHTQKVKLIEEKIFEEWFY